MPCPSIVLHLFIQGKHTARIYFVIKVALTHLLYKFFSSGSRCKYTPHKTSRLTNTYISANTNPIKSIKNAVPNRMILALSHFSFEILCGFFEKSFQTHKAAATKKKLPKLSSPPLIITCSSLVGVTSHISPVLKFTLSDTTIISMLTPAPIQYRDRFPFKFPFCSFNCAAIIKNKRLNKPKYRHNSKINIISMISAGYPVYNL